jgi:hypothetical protein
VWLCSAQLVVFNIKNKHLRCYKRRDCDLQYVYFTHIIPLNHRTLLFLLLCVTTAPFEIIKQSVISSRTEQIGVLEMKFLIILCTVHIKCVLIKNHKRNFCFATSRFECFNTFNDGCRYKNFKVSIL